MKHVIAYTAADGGLAIVRPVATPDAAETEAAFLFRLATAVVPADARDIQVLPADALPDDRLFRAAWCVAPAGGVMIDPLRARALRLGQIRAARDRLLARLDGPMLRALEAGDQPVLARLQARRQALRDLPVMAGAALEALSNPVDLAAFWPADLAEEHP
jgi:hypothetical protein